MGMTLSQSERETYTCRRILPEYLGLYSENGVINRIRG
jgi:hypothetical protein